MPKKKNALAELAEQIKKERNALAFYRSEYSPVLDKAQRIIDELAKADLGEIHMAAILPNGGRLIQSCIDAAVWNATDTVDKCRAIAEEGGAR